MLIEASNRMKLRRFVGDSRNAAMRAPVRFFSKQTFFGARERIAARFAEIPALGGGLRIETPPGKCHIIVFS